MQHFKNNKGSGIKAKPLDGTD